MGSCLAVWVFVLVVLACGDDEEDVEDDARFQVHRHGSLAEVLFGSAFLWRFFPRLFPFLTESFGR